MRNINCGSVRSKQDQGNFRTSRFEKFNNYFMSGIHCIGMISVIFACSFTVNAGDVNVKWYKGQLHTHSYWSDGRGFPEQAIAEYKKRNYDFLSITDHNRFAARPDEWREVFPEEGPWPPKITETIFNNYIKYFGNNCIETKEAGGKKLVRLKTYSELKKKFEEPGKFLLLPGVEITQCLNGGNIHLHVNYINIPELIPCLEGSELIQGMNAPTISKLLTADCREVMQCADKLNVPYLLFVNHPFWRYYDVTPDALTDNPEVRFFEICNGGAECAPLPEAADYPDKFWDVVNAFRALKGQNLLYGIASDDAHFYDAARMDLCSGVGDAWIMVRCNTLAPESLFRAMRKGDFYATCGILLDDLSFNPADRTLHLKVKAEKGLVYRIHFITTKKNFDQSVKRVTIDKEGLKRIVPLYSKSIGRIAKTVIGTDASYKLADDDLYVRAKIESDRPCKFKAHFHPDVESAWTQPYKNTLCDSIDAVGDGNTRIDSFGSGDAADAKRVNSLRH